MRALGYLRRGACDVNAGEGSGRLDQTADSGKSSGVDGMWPRSKR